MKYIEWTPALRTGSSSIDVQHKALIHAINELGRDLEEGKGATRIQKSISFLKYYTENGTSDKKKTARQNTNAQLLRRTNTHTLSLLPSLISSSTTCATPTTLKPSPKKPMP